MVTPHTLLQTAHLANLWQLCKMSNPAGRIVDVGVFRGGSSLHLMNCDPGRTVYVCDTFESFSDIPLDDKLDKRFDLEQFSSTSREQVETTLAGHGSNFEIIQGRFPASDVAGKVRNVSFAHIDVDVYSSAIETLRYLRPFMLQKSIIVLDDYFRSADGMIKAVAEFVAEAPDWCAFPIYPGQGIMIHRSWLAHEKESGPQLQLSAGAELAPKLPGCSSDLKAAIQPGRDRDGG
jgi:hypothetical protein